MLTLDENHEFQGVLPHVAIYILSPTDNSENVIVHAAISNVKLFNNTIYRGLKLFHYIFIKT